jgi:hypothetical protein
VIWGVKLNITHRLGEFPGQAAPQGYSLLLDGPHFPSGSRGSSINLFHAEFYCTFYDFSAVGLRVGTALVEVFFAILRSCVFSGVRENDPFGISSIVGFGEGKI